MKHHKSSAADRTVKQKDPSGEVVPYGDTEVKETEREPAAVYEHVDNHPPRHPRWCIPYIRKDDEFFHFVILCFAAGASLVCYYKYNNWIVALGVGLMTFASLETTGIYFGLVYRIRSILEGFVPLLQRVQMPGFRKVN
uniref:Transmembrane protein 40 n=1 Tax=Pogona vitticeps TaxID=103695 RepID=A0ABM5FK08_9SAUR